MTNNFSPNKIAYLIIAFCICIYFLICMDEMNNNSEINYSSNQNADNTPNKSTNNFSNNF